jgi:nitronate monooxygenase
MIRKASGEVNGFIVENHTAGGHNAPPRRVPKPDSVTVPQFGPKDAPNIDRIKELGKPFWLAGGYASPEKLKEALDAGANGIQVGTVFAYCTESAIMPEIRKTVIDRLLTDRIETLTDFEASPTGYPFKLIDLNNDLTSVHGCKARHRICDLGLLQQFVCDENAEIVYRCPGEPLESYLRKGGAEADTHGKMCLCNGLLATIGLGQVRETGRELPILTAGEDFSTVKAIAGHLRREYSAGDVIDYLLSRQATSHASSPRKIEKTVSFYRNEACIDEAPALTVQA